MSEQKRLLKNTGIIAIGNLSTKLISFLLLPVYTAILSASEYGTVDYIVCISTFCIPFISLLMDEAMFRFLIDCKSEEEKKNVISMSMIIIGVGAIAFILITYPILYFIKYKYSMYFIFYILTSVFCTMLSALLRGIGRTDKYAVFNFLISLAQILFNVLFIAVFYWGVKGMLLASIVAHFIVPSYYVIKMKLWKYIEFSGLSMKKAKEMVKYSIPLIPNKISWSIINLSDRIIIMNTIGSNASGLYAVSYKFPNLMDTIYGFFYQSWKESSARVANDDSKDAFYNMVYTYLKSIMYSVSILMISFMPLAYYLLINKSYNQAMLYVPILLLGTYFSNVSGFYGGIFTASKDTKIMGTTTIVAAILNLTINVLLIYRLGLYAAAISTLVANLVVCIYRKIKVRKYVELEEDYNKTLLAIVVTIIVCSLFYSMKFELQLIGCIVAICYALFSNRKIIMMIFERMKKLQLRSKCCEK